MNYLASIAEAAIFASSLSIDAFMAGFAYGSKKIKIPILSGQIINLVCSTITGLSLFAGAIVKPYLPEWLAIAVAFTLLFIIGLTKLLDGITKLIIRRYSELNKEFKVSAFNFKFILNLYADPEKADIDESHLLSPTEAAVLALSLSLDGIAVGFGATLANVNGPAIVAWSFITNAVAIITGCYLGNKLASKLSLNISWLSGVVLITLAFSKLL